MTKKLDEKNENAEMNGLLASMAAGKIGNNQARFNGNATNDEMNTVLVGMLKGRKPGIGIPAGEDDDR